MGLCTVPLWLECKLDEIRLAGKVIGRNGFSRQQFLTTHALRRLPSPPTSVDGIRSEDSASSLGFYNSLKDWRILIRWGGTRSSPNCPGSGRIRRRRCAQAELPCWPPVPVVTRFTRNGPSFIKV